MNYQQYWSEQSDSQHRSKANFYQKKAEEHTFLLGSDANLPCADIGCGAGELLLELLNNKVKIVDAIDYSPKMLEEAKKKLHSSNINFLNIDTFIYLENSKVNTWTACGSINQYLTKKEQEKVLDLFVKNDNAQSVYLFDTVCPARYILWSKSKILNFNSPTNNFSYLRKIYGFLKGLLLATFKPQSLEYLPIKSMGYAFSPSLFIKMAQDKELSIEIINSLHYEYRYHVIIKKIPTKKHTHEKL